MLSSQWLLAIDMISVIFIRGKLLKLHAPMSIHATSVSPDQPRRDKDEGRGQMTESVVCPLGR